MNYFYHKLKHLNFAFNEQIFITDQILSMHSPGAVFSAFLTQKLTKQIMHRLSTFSDEFSAIFY